MIIISQDKIKSFQFEGIPDVLFCESESIVNIGPVSMDRVAETSEIQF